MLLTRRTVKFKQHYYTSTQMSDRKKYFDFSRQSWPKQPSAERVVGERGRKELPPGTKGGENMKPDRHAGSPLFSTGSLRLSNNYSDLRYPLKQQLCPPKYWLNAVKSSFLNFVKPKRICSLVRAGLFICFCVISICNAFCRSSKSASRFLYHHYI